MTSNGLRIPSGYQLFRTAAEPQRLCLACAAIYVLIVVPPAVSSAPSANRGGRRKATRVGSSHIGVNLYTFEVALGPQ